MKNKKTTNLNQNKRYHVGVACYATQNKQYSVGASWYATQNKQSHVGAGPVSAQNAITLVALVITVIIILILAGVTINLTIGNNGIFKTAQQAAKNYTDAQNKELANLNEFNQNLEEITDINNINQFDKTVGVNKPKLMSGMTPIKFEFKAGSTEKATTTAVADGSDWYNYEAKQWANAQTADGSMWVWIPRYAYRINKVTQTCDIKFLIGSTDQYYDENGNIQTAKRQTKADETIDTSIGYTVHPAFTDESKIEFANGGWDKELTGIWVAKFEAGYAGEVANNKASQVDSKIHYTQMTAYVGEAESLTGTGATEEARNCIDGVYAVKNPDGTYSWKNGATEGPAIKYPTFQGTTCSMNYININDAFNISRALTGEKNIYGLNASQTDSHLMKNSEWGACAYLGQSQYGLNGNNIYINNVNLNNSTPSVYAVTGCCAKTSADAGSIIPTMDDIKSGKADCYVWNEVEGQKASCTGTIYGVYDMSGGTCERTAGYVANGNGNLKTDGVSIAYNGDKLRTASTKYTTVYPHNSDVDKSGADLETAAKANYAKNNKIYGDAIRETSNEGRGANSWYGDYSSFPAVYNPFTMRGGKWNYGSYDGLFYFNCTYGNCTYDFGFRSVLVAE